MKKIVWIIGFTLGVVSLAHGMTTAQPAPEPPAVYGGGTTAVAPGEKPGPFTAEPQPAHAGFFGSGAPQGGPWAVTGRPTGPEAPVAMMPREEEPVPGRLTPLTAPIGMPGGPPGAPVEGGSIIRLRDPETGETYGPFELRDRGGIMIGGRTYILELVQKTKEQAKLEEKLRSTIIPQFTIESGKLMEVVDFLSREGDVNIVVTGAARVCESDITMRLRNIPLYDTIRYVTEVADVKFRIDDHAVVITGD